jgi:hypothetical protein
MSDPTPPATLCSRTLRGRRAGQGSRMLRGRRAGYILECPLKHALNLSPKLCLGFSRIRQSFPSWQRPTNVFRALGSASSPNLDCLSVPTRSQYTHHWCWSLVPSAGVDHQMLCRRCCRSLRTLQPVAAGGPAPRSRGPYSALSWSSTLLIKE